MGGGGGAGVGGGGGGGAGVGGGGGGRGRDGGRELQVLAIAEKLVDIRTLMCVCVSVWLCVLSV